MSDEEKKTTKKSKIKDKKVKEEEKEKEEENDDHKVEKDTDEETGCEKKGTTLQDQKDKRLLRLKVMKSSRGRAYIKDVIISDFVRRLQKIFLRRRLL
jgi:hypothetical protein